MSEITVLSKEETQLLADKILKPIINIIDKHLFRFDIARLDGTIKNMEQYANNTAAWPFEETMDKAKELQAINDLFISIVDVIKKRMEQRNVMSRIQKSKNDKIELLKEIGL